MGTNAMELGWKFFHGIGRRKNYHVALHYLGHAARQGYVQAQFVLAYSYAHGLGTRKNLKLAVHWYKPAARKLHPDALSISRWHTI
jgi:TPR repeat protein